MASAGARLLVGWLIRTTHCADGVMATYGVELVESGGNFAGVDIGTVYGTWWQLATYSHGHTRGGN